MIKLWFAIVVLSGMLSASAANALPLLFEDTFDGENGGVGATNYTGFDNWTVSDGFVDLIGNNFFDLYPGNGLYVDLDGSGSNAGILTSTPISVQPGKYFLEFELGVNPGFGDSPMTFSFGSYSEQFAVGAAGVSPNFNFVTRIIQINSAGDYPLIFNQQGGDDFGLVIDDVRLYLYPEPTSAALAAIGLVGLVTSRRSRCSSVC